MRGRSATNRPRCLAIMGFRASRAQAVISQKSYSFLAQFFLDCKRCVFLDCDVSLFVVVSIQFEMEPVSSGHAPKGGVGGLVEVFIVEVYICAGWI